MEFNEEEIEAGRASAQSIGVFVHVDCDPALAVWMGVGHIALDIPAIDPVNKIEFMGAGQLMGVPALNYLLNGKAERNDITMSGVSDNVMEKAANGNAAQQVKGKRVLIGVGIFSPRYGHMLGPVHWMRRGIADSVRISRTPASSPGETTVNALMMSVGSLTTGLRRGAYSFFTYEDQKARSNGTDEIFDRMSRMFQGYRITWPRW